MLNILKRGMFISDDRKVKVVASQVKFSKNLNLIEQDWGSIYRLPHIITKVNKLKEFQFKIIHRYLPTNKLLKKYGITDSAGCTFCHLQSETLEHMFFECSIVRTFWLHFMEWWKSENGDKIVLRLKDILLGYEYNQPPISLNQAILKAKSYIFKSKLFWSKPSIEIFVAQLKYNTLHC